MPKKTTNGQKATTSTEAKLKGFIFAFYNCRKNMEERNFEHPCTCYVLAYDKKEAKHLFESAVELWESVGKFERLPNFHCVIKSMRRNKKNVRYFTDDYYKRQYDFLNDKRTKAGLSLI